MDREKIKLLLKHLERNKHNLSPYQAEFVKGVKKYFSKNNKLTDKQTEALININNSVMAEK